MITIAKRSLRWLLQPLVMQRAPGNTVWLTFDDGPHPQGTPQVLDALDAAGVRATFFMIGREMELHPQLVEAVRARGHGIALHGFEHKHAADLSWSQQLADLRCMRAVAARFGVRLAAYRPAYGELTPLRLAWCALHRVRIVMWSYESRDSFVKDAAELAERVSPQSLSGGDIALFHDDTPATAQALPTILANARAAGVRFAIPT